jgi:hypothetical protein
MNKEMLKLATGLNPKHFAAIVMTILDTGSYISGIVLRSTGNRLKPAPVFKSSVSCLQLENLWKTVN